MNSYKLAATVLVFLAMVLHQLINRKTTKIDIEKMVISVPSELTFLILGFLLPELSATTQSTEVFSKLIPILIVLLLLVIQYAIENLLIENILFLGAKKFWLLFTYPLAFLVYYLAVIRG